MARHLILGAGPVGRATASHLAADGHHVLLANRSGSGPTVPIEAASHAAVRIERVAVDATDPKAVTALAAGSAAVFNCLNPAAYQHWERDWPPMAAAALAAAGAADAVLVTTSNLYAYGVVDGPMTAATPDRPIEPKGAVRAAMWAQAREAHAAGRVRTAEVRSSDYVGRGVGAGGHLTRQIPALRNGRTAWVVGDADQPHSWTDVSDVARTLVAVAERPQAHGRVWIVPSAAPRTQRQGLADLAQALGVPLPTVRAIPRAVLTAAGVGVPMLRELRRSDYQFTRPFVVDATETKRALGLAPTPWERSCAASLELDPAHDVPIRPR